ncbi:MAG: hypothetical protein AAGG50_04735, partial [Bacteroidota bacterium]
DERVPDLAPPPPALPTEPFTLSLDSAPDDLPTLDDSEDLLDDVWTSADDLPPPEPLDVSPPDLDAPFAPGAIGSLSSGLDAPEHAASGFEDATVEDAPPAAFTDATVTDATEDAGVMEDAEVVMDADLVDPDVVDGAGFDTMGFRETTSYETDASEEADAPDPLAFAAPPAFELPAVDLGADDVAADDLAVGTFSADGLAFDEPVTEELDLGNPLARDEAAALDTVLAFEDSAALDGPPVFDDLPVDDTTDGLDALFDDATPSGAALSDLLASDDAPLSSDPTDEDVAPLPLGSFDADAFASDPMADLFPVPDELPPVTLASPELDEAPADALEAAFDDAFDAADAATDMTLDAVSTADAAPTTPQGFDLPPFEADALSDETDSPLDSVNLAAPNSDDEAEDEAALEPTGSAVSDLDETSETEADPLRPPASEFFGFDVPEDTSSFPDVEDFLAMEDDEDLDAIGLSLDGAGAGDVDASYVDAEDADGGDESPVAHEDDAASEDQTSATSTADFFGTFAIQDARPASDEDPETFAEAPVPPDTPADGSATLDVPESPWAPVPDPLASEGGLPPVELDTTFDEFSAALDAAPDEDTPDFGNTAAFEDTTLDSSIPTDATSDESEADDGTSIAPHLLGGFAALGAAGALWSDRDETEAGDAPLPANAVGEPGAEDTLIPDEALEPLDAIYDEVSAEDVPTDEAPTEIALEAEPEEAVAASEIVVEADAWTTPETPAAPPEVSSFAPDDPDGPLGAPWGIGTAAPVAPTGAAPFPDGIPPADPVTMPLTADLFEETPAPAVAATATAPEPEEEKRASWPWLMLLPLLLLLSFGVYALWERLAAPTQAEVTLTDPSAPLDATEEATATDPSLADGALTGDDVSADDAILDDADAPPDPFDSDASAADAPTTDAPESLLAEEPAEEPATEEAAPPSGLYGEGRIDLDQGGYTWVVTNPDGGRTPEQQAAQYRAQGFRSGVVQGRVEGAVVERVCLGQFATLESAREARGQLPGSVPNSSWVLRLSSPTVVR